MGLFSSQGQSGSSYGSSQSQGYQQPGRTQAPAGRYQPPKAPAYTAATDPGYKQYLGAYNNPNGYGNPTGSPQLSYQQWTQNAPLRNRGAGGGNGQRGIDYQTGWHGWQV